MDFVPPWFLAFRRPLSSFLVVDIKTRSLSQHGRATNSLLAHHYFRRSTAHPPLLVPLHVEGEVVRPGEAPVALAALEGLDAGVLAQVPGQLVRPREPPLAALPRAPVRLLT